MNQVIKQVIKVGNSAGVLVPKEWMNGKAKVELIVKPINIKKDILEILEPYLEDVIGIYLVGSYARGEQTERSDVDVLVITNKISRRVKRGKYDVLLITRKQIDNTLENNALPIIPMLKEAKGMLNDEYLKSIKNQQLSKKNIRWNMDMIKSALNIDKKLIELKKDYSEYVGDSVSYSLILNIRSLYIIECLRKNQKWGTEGFKSFIKRISGSLEAYEGYLRVKNDEKTKKALPIEGAEKLLDYAYKMLIKQEKWIKRKD